MFHILQSISSDFYWDFHQILQTYGMSEDQAILNPVSSPATPFWYCNEALEISVTIKNWLIVAHIDVHRTSHEPLLPPRYYIPLKKAGPIKY